MAAGIAHVKQLVTSQVGSVVVSHARVSSALHARQQPSPSTRSTTDADGGGKQTLQKMISDTNIVSAEGASYTQVSQCHFQCQCHCKGDDINGNAEQPSYDTDALLRQPVAASRRIRRAVIGLNLAECLLGSLVICLVHSLSPSLAETYVHLAILQWTGSVPIVIGATGAVCAVSNKRVLMITWACGAIVLLLAYLGLVQLVDSSLTLGPPGQQGQREQGQGRLQGQPQHQGQGEQHEQQQPMPLSLLVFLHDCHTHTVNDTVTLCVCSSSVKQVTLVHMPSTCEYIRGLTSRYMGLLAADIFCLLTPLAAVIMVLIDLHCIKHCTYVEPADDELFSTVHGARWRPAPPSTVQPLSAEPPSTALRPLPGPLHSARVYAISQGASSDSADSNDHVML